MLISLSYFFLVYTTTYRKHRNQRTLNRQAGGHLRGDLLNQTASNIEDILRAIDSSTVRNYKSYFRRKTTKSPDGEDKRNHDGEIVKKNKVINISILNNSKEANEDENRLDYGLMTFGAAGEGKDSDDARFKKDESKKTLSDQIAEGKYGLIEKELFSKTPKAPGIISYKTNSETPNDNEKTLGGLSKDEIWLAEDHLLVLKGGINSEKKGGNNWAPIDDYEAPKRPVKIPLNPRVPPPFPIQLTEDGPIQFVGKNQFSLFNPFTNETGLFANVDGHISPYLPSSNGNAEKDFASGLGAVKDSSKDSIQDVISPPSWLFHNSYKDVDLLKHFPFNLPLPDQALNKTEDFDEDDPSLFYPPPYSFVYKTNYTNLAPVGPLVPGIILPPPPDFFSVYEEEKKPIKTPLDAYKRIKEIQLKNRLSATSTTMPPPTKSSTSGYIRDFTRKPKLPSTVITPTKLVKAKTTKIPASSTTVRPPTILYSTSSPDILKFKTNHFETTTLKLHPVYLPTAKLYTSTTFSTTTTTPMPPTQQVKQYQKDYGTQAHPIYFEYFDARTTNPFVSQQYEYNNPSSASSSTTTTTSPMNNNFNQQRTHKKPKQYYPPQFISSTISPANIDTKYLFVTPKPEYQQNFGATDSPSYNYNTAIPVQKPLVLKPVGKYEDEIAAIKQTLDYYKSGSSGKKPTKPQKVKAVYEFSFEASKHKNQENFKPMISYDQNVYAKKPDVKYSHIEELINANGYFPTTQEPTIKYYRTKQAATLPPKKQSYDDSLSPMMIYGQKLNYHVRPFLKEFVTTPQQSQPQKIIVYPSHETMNNGYRINSKNVKYRNQQNYGTASEVASLLNDTLINYKQPQRPINPLSENIDVQRYPSHRPPIQNNPQQFYPQHQQPTFYHPPPPPVYSQQRPFHHYHNQQQHHSADYVKYGYPIISQINPESVHITFYNKPMEKSNENF